MIVDGKKLAADILARTKARAAALPRPPRITAVFANETAATRSYLRIKEARAPDAGCVLEAVRVGTTDAGPRALSAELADAVSRAARGADAVIVQLPLPAAADPREVCDAIPPEKDADVLSTAARARCEQAEGAESCLLPPVVGAVLEILKTGGVDPRGKRAAVVGRGFLVGAPVAAWLRQQGADVRLVDMETPRAEFAAALRAADIIVSGAGSAHLIKPEMITDGVVLIDAGTSIAPSASHHTNSVGVVGDADPSCAGRCSLFTPVPGGVGPVAVAKLFENAVILAERKPFIS